MYRLSLRRPARERRAIGFDVIRIAYQACRQLGIREPKIGVAGWNPHAGGNGIFGKEEIEEITPGNRRRRWRGLSGGTSLTRWDSILQGEARLVRYCGCYVPRPGAYSNEGSGLCIQPGESAVGHGCRGSMLLWGAYYPGYPWTTELPSTRRGRDLPANKV